jgi:hypothetical protein
VDVLDAAQAGKSLTEALADAVGEEEGGEEGRRGGYSRKKPPMLSVKLGGYRREREKGGEEGSVAEDVMAAWTGLGGCKLGEY